MSNSQICRDIMLPMTQDLTENEVNVNEEKLNEDIYNLLDGIDFEQSMSQTKSPIYISSTLAEENGNNLDGMDFEQFMSQSKSPTCIPSTLPEENGIHFEQSVSQLKSPTCIPSTIPEENGFKLFSGKKDEKEVKITQPPLFTEDKKAGENENSIPVESMEIFPQVHNTDSDLYHSTANFDKGNMSVEEKAVTSMSVPTPVIQPFICMEEKSPQNYEDPMDTLEEIPVRDVGDTYLNDEQFNQKYPKHLVDEEQQQQQQVQEMETIFQIQGPQQIHEEQQQQPMETVPYIMSMDELALFLDDQEKIGKVLGENTREMDNFLLSEIVNGNSVAEEPMDVQDEQETSSQSNQVCFISFILYLEFFKSIL